MKIRVEQVNPVIGDLKGNHRAITKAVSRAVSAGVDLLVLPEVVVAGYPPQDLLESETFRNGCYEINRQIIESSSSTAILFGSITANLSGVGRKIYNSGILAHQGQLIGKADKTLLPNYDVFDDLRYFEPALRRSCLELEGVKLGVTICEDIWYNENEVQYHDYDINPAEELKAEGAEILINLSASPFTRNKQQRRLEMLRNHARTLGLPVLYSNQTGGQGELLFDGNSMVLDSAGELIAIAEPFRPAHRDVVWERGKGVRAWNASGEAAEPDKNEIEPTSDKKGEVSTSDRISSLRSDRSDKLHTDKYGRIFMAIVAGLQDYLRKTAVSEKAILGLSGGIDSALVAVLAAEALGAENVTCLTMPGEFSSADSLSDSEHLANRLGISLHQLPIHQLYDQYLKELSPLFRDTGFGVAEENLQSRIRGALLMACSNKFNQLLLTTGNKSEIAVGYATLYGDMNGALNPIGDLYKTEVFELCQWLNQEYFVEEVIPQNILEKPPSAELRPDQKDSDSLPEYNILDDILYRYVELQQEAEKIISEGAHSPKTVRHVLRMVDQNEFKRFQAPPILKLSSKSFGSGRRWPLVQGWAGNRLPGV